MGTVHALLLLDVHQLSPLQPRQQRPQSTQVGSVLRVCKSSSSLNENVLNSTAEDCTLRDDTSKEAVEGTAVCYVLTANICKNTICQRQTLFFKCFFPHLCFFLINGKQCTKAKLAVEIGIILKLTLTKTFTIS